MKTPILLDESDEEEMEIARKGLSWVFESMDKIGCVNTLGTLGFLTFAVHQRMSDQSNELFDEQIKQLSGGEQ